MRLAPTLLVALAAAACGAVENAALAQYGAQIRITCDNPKPLNARWAKPADLLKAQKPGGPIINTMASARVALRFPRPLTVQRIVLGQMGAKDGWTRANRVEVRVGGKAVHVQDLDLSDDKPQGFDVPPVATAELELAVVGVAPDAKVAYGGFHHLQVLVAEDVAALFAPPPEVERPAFTMATPNLGDRPAVRVIGEPRKAEGWPRTLWDSQDIAELKRQIAAVPAAKDAYERCIAFCEQSVAKPVQVPEQPDDGVNGAIASGHTNAVNAIANLGIGYALSGDERYAKEVRRMLLRYADLYEGWPIHGSPNFKHDQSKWSWQRLGDAIWLIQAAWGYDLVHASPSLSDEDRQRINDRFMKPCVDQILRSSGIIAAPTNWSAICSAAVMIASRVSGYEEKYRWAIDGLPKKAAPKRKGAEAEAPAAPPAGDAPSGNRGGIYFYLDEAIDDDGMWAEGAIGYQFMAMRGLLVMAEILWRDGVDVYGYRNSRMKLVFDSPIWYCYPGGGSSPAIHDSGSSSLFGRDAHLYQYALRRYGDRSYNAILGRIAPSLASVYNLFLPAVDFAPVEAVDLPSVPSILFPGVGFATARTGQGEDQRYLLMDYGPNRSHGHPDKLSHCFFALGQELYGDGGSAWYSTDVYRYYSHSLAHNTVLANGESQIATGGRLEAYCQAGDMAVIRATCGSAIPATGLDRTLVLLGDRLYDIFQVRSGIPATLDLPLHSAGALEAGPELAAGLKPWPDEQREGIYGFLDDPRSAALSGDWTCTWQVPLGRMRLHAIGEEGTEVVLARTPKGGGTVGMAMLRRTTTDTVFASASDVIANGHEASIAALRRLRAPDAEGLEADLAGGGSETVLANRGTGAISLGGFGTDAGVAAVRRRGDAASGFVLSGGTFLRGPGVDLRLSAPGQVSAYVARDGLIRFTNHGPAAVEVEWRGLAAAQVAQLDDAGAWTARAPLAGGRFAVPARSAVDLSAGGEESVATYEDAQRRAKQRAAWEAEQRRLAQQAAAMAELKAAAAREPVPADYLVVVEAESPSAQGGGNATFPTNKTGARGTSLSGWNNRGHWVEYALEVEHTGWYQLALKYCVEGEEASRGILLDGKPLHPDLEAAVLPGTGGWSNGADQWSLAAIGLPGSPDAMLVRLERGAHTIRLTNVAGGGMNLDYLVLAPAQAKPTRERIEKP